MAASFEFAAARPEIDKMGRALPAERGRPIFAAVVNRFSFDPDSGLAALVERGYADGQFRDDLSLDLVRVAVLTVVTSGPRS